MQSLNLVSTQYVAAIDRIYSALLTAGVLVGLPGVSPSSPQDLGI